MPEQKIIFYTFLVYIFTLPLFFLPFNYEIFEFNKTLLTFAITIIITSTWIIACLRHQRFILKTHLLTWPMLLFLASQIISTLFSIDKYLSLWGYYSRFHQSLLHTIAYTILFHAFITWITPKQTRSILKALFLSTTITALYGFFQHFGIDANYWVQDVKNRVFASLGQPNWLATWLILTSLPGFIYLNKSDQTISYIYFLLTTIILLFTKSKSGYIGFLLTLITFISLLFLSSYSHKLKNPQIKTPTLLLGIFFILSLLIWNPSNLYLGSPKFKTHPSKTSPPPRTRSSNLNITSSVKIRQIVWQGAINLWKSNPKNFLIGTGVETFAFTYPLTRPLAHNLTSEWDFIYNKAHNEYLNFLTTTGLIGLVTYLVFAFALLYFLFTISTPLSLSWTSAVFGYLVAIFFGFSITPTTLLLYLIPAFISTLTSHPSPLSNSQRFTLFSITSTLIVLGITFKLLSFLLTWWLADYYLTQANKLFKQNQYITAHKLYLKAYQLNQIHPIFAINLGKGLTFQTLLLAQQKQLLEKSHSQLTQTQLQQLQHQINQTITANIDLIRSLTNQAYHQHPTNIENRKQTIRFYALLGSINPSYYQTAITLLRQLLPLAPTDPRLPYNLGILYSFINQPQNQEKCFLTAIRLKPNYDRAYHQLAKLYQSQNQTQKLKNLLLTWQKNHPNSPTLKTWLKQTQKNTNN